MLKQHKKLIASSLYVTDMAVTILSFFLAYWIRSHYLTQLEFRPLYPIESYYWLLLLIIPLWSLILFHFGAYRSYRTVSLNKELRTIGKAVLLGGLAIGAVAFILKSYYLSRTLIVIFVVINISFLAVERLSIRAFSRLMRRKGYNYRNIIIVGTDKTAIDIAKVIEEHKRWGLNMIGFVTDTATDNRSKMDGHTVIGQIGELQEIINREVVDEVVFALPRDKLALFEEVLLMLEDNGIDTRIAVDFFPHAVAKIYLDELANIPLLTFTTKPVDSVALALKRCFDIVTSLTLLIALFPIIMIIALAIKGTSSGPAFFKQKRCGLHGRIFTLYKFRSMVSDAEARKKDIETMNEMSGPVFKIKNDPRVTKIGRFIRRTSIDELPQLWNVLKGDMSIVGPRPPLPEEVAKYKRWQRRRLSMRPGLTCLWQIQGRNTIKDFDEWAKLDLQYIDQWSLSLDMMIFFKTIPVVLFGKGSA